VENPLLKEPLRPEHIKNRLLGHWGSSPGLSFIYTHLNRSIKKYDLDMIFMAGPGHGAPGVLGPCYLEGTYSEVYPAKERRHRGPARILQGVFLPRRNRQPLHARDARLHPRRRRVGLRALACLRRRFRQCPELIVAAVVGDGESETGPLATSWHIDKFLNPIRDGAVLPILHLNGYKINNPTLLARISAMTSWRT
jgi:xylulose-5-phosphate/fructose-6-phosphate phosphoketolase